MYQIEPIGVVIPRHQGDVVATVDIARRHQVPVLPRGGGTSLAGQTVGHAVVTGFFEVPEPDPGSEHRRELGACAAGRHPG